VDVELVVVPFRAEHAGAPAGGPTLRELRARFGGDEGEVEDMYGRIHRLSLAPFADRDPDETALAILFRPRSEDQPGRPIYEMPSRPATHVTLGRDAGVAERGYTTSVTVGELRERFGRARSAEVLDASKTAHRVELELAELDDAETLYLTFHYV
jgi:hypothetical protein